MTTPQRTHTSTDNVAEEIKTPILAGNFAPGQRLVESELRESYGASRGSVRAALVDLTHEGLVERIANRGARVRVVGVEEAVEITEVRMVLEGLCAAKAAERVDDTHIQELQQLGRDMQAAVATWDVVTYSQLNQRLHALVAEAACLETAAEVLARLKARNVLHQFRLALRPGRPQVSLPQHLAIIDAVCARDPQAAEAARCAHLRSVIEALRRDDSIAGV